jgi:hypothetical protein
MSVRLNSPESCIWLISSAMNFAALHSGKIYARTISPSQARKHKLGLITTLYFIFEARPVFGAFFLPSLVRTSSARSSQFWSLLSSFLLNSFETKT